jgi:opacity protein-like surface antigen
VVAAIRRAVSVAGVVALVALTARAAIAQEPMQNTEQAPTRSGPQTYVQGWIGGMGRDDAWSIEDPDGDQLLDGDDSRLFLGGGVGQRLWGDRVEYGFEGGAVLSFVNDKLVVAGANPGLRIAVDNELFASDFFMGAVVSVRPTRWLRLYAAAGPSLAWGLLNGSDEDNDPPDNDGLVIVGPGAFLVIDLDDTIGDTSFSPYARVGLDFEVSGVSFGISARYTDHKLNFGERGTLKLDGVQWFLTIGGSI